MEYVDTLRAPDTQWIIAHYERVAPLLAASFAGIPFTTVFLPDGFSGDVVRVGQLHKPVPPAIPTIEVTTRSGPHRYIALTENTILWRAHEHAVGFESWTPRPGHPLVPHFARIVVRVQPGTPLQTQRNVLQAVQAALNEDNLAATFVLAGDHTALWIPLVHTPPYDVLRAQLHALLDEAYDHTEWFDDNTWPASVTLSVSSNAPGHGTGLPYTLRAEPGFPMNVPITWDELDTIDPFAYDVDNAAERLAAGDVFAQQVALFRPQNAKWLPHPKRFHRLELGPPYETPAPRSEVVTLALEILADGKPRSVAEIEEEAIARGLWPKNERRKYLYAMLKAYIEKSIARDEKPLIVQDPDHRFRLNHPRRRSPRPQNPNHRGAPRNTSSTRCAPPPAAPTQPHSNAPAAPHSNRSALKPLTSAAR